jgi:predicted aconitase with swiveling domain
VAEILLKGHKVSKGKAEGEALVSHEPISFKQGVNPQAGIVIEKGHELEGVSLTGKILVFPLEKGSTQGSYVLYEMTRCKTAPKGIINLRAEPVIALGAIVSNIPMIDKLDRNPLELIRSGDYVEMDADNGIVRIRRRAG